MSANVRIPAFPTDRFRQLCHDLSATLTELGAQQLAAKAETLINRPASSPLTVLLCGSAGSGKSTLLSALAGEALRLPGEPRNKSRVHRASWNDLLLVDDPHLADLPLEAMADAMSAYDLLVFVIPCRLFTQKERALFKYLAFSRQRRRQMMLVVTKMSMSDQDEAALSARLVDQLAPEAAPDELASFYPTFVDLVDYLQSAGDPELLRLSNYDQLQTRLAEFVRQRGPAGQWLRPIDLARSVITEGLLLLADGKTALDPLTAALHRRLQRHEAEAALHTRRTLFELSQKVLSACTPRNAAATLLREKPALPQIGVQPAEANPVSVLTDGLMALFHQQRNSLATEFHEVVEAEAPFVQELPPLLHHIQGLLLTVWDHPICLDDAREMATTALNLWLPECERLGHHSPRCREPLMAGTLARRLLEQVEPFQKQALMQLADGIEELSGVIRQEAENQASARNRLLAIATLLENLTAELLCALPAPGGDGVGSPGAPG